MIEYYGDGCDFEILNNSMILDPRFKNVSFASSDSLLDELTEAATERSIAATPVHPHNMLPPPVCLFQDVKKEN